MEFGEKTLYKYKIIKMKYRILIFLFSILASFPSCAKQPGRLPVLTGADVLLSTEINKIKNLNIGIITNHSAVLSNGVHLVDSLNKTNGIRIKAIFTPEHGFRGNIPGGVVVDKSIDTATGIPLISLYGKVRKPTAESLKDIDLLIFDIQDIGARFYTYISTLFLSMQAAAENSVEFMILDRPNPIGGIKVDGPVIDDSLKSFVGIAPLPIMHGMTVGELGMFFNRPEILRTGQPAKLSVIKMKNWERSFYFDDCGIPWVKPSPNMVSVEAEIVYPGMCLLEATNVSEGRGTQTPFLTFGAPFINPEELILELNKFKIQGLTYSDTAFTPVPIAGMSNNPKYKNEKCYGLNLKVTDRKAFQPVKFGVILLSALHKLYPSKFKLKEKRLGKLFGKTYLAKMIYEGRNPGEIISLWKEELEKFKKERKKYLLY